MTRIITSRDDLIKALLVIKEDLNEKNRQEEMTKKIEKISLDEEEGSEEEKEEEPKTKDSSNSEEKKDKKELDKNLPGADELLSSPPQVPSSISSIEIIDKINKIRAGSSLKSKEVQNKIDAYITSLNNQEQKNLWIYLDALARIILAGSDPAEVSAPDLKSNEKPASKPSFNVPNSFLPIVSPVIVGEGVKKSIRETDVPLRSGKLVPFGSRSHIKDIEMRIEDLERIRSYQERGSESRQALSIAINALRSELRSANRKNPSKTEEISE